VLQLARLGILTKALVRDMAKARRFAGNVCMSQSATSMNQQRSKRLSNRDRALLLPANNANQVEQERTFIDTAKRAGVQHIVKFSAFGADDPKSASRSSLACRSRGLLEASGLAWTPLRPCIFMQNLLGFRRFDRWRVCILLAAWQHARGSRRCARHCGRCARDSHERVTREAYTITGPEALTYSEVAEKLPRRSVNRFATSMFRRNNSSRACSAPACRIGLPTRCWKYLSTW